MQCFRDVKFRKDRVNCSAEAPPRATNDLPVVVQPLVYEFGIAAVVLRCAIVDRASASLEWLRSTLLTIACLVREAYTRPA